MTDHVLVTDAEGVRTITLNRADKRNALTAAMYAAMADAMASADADGQRVILFQGAGGFFTGGNDIGDFLANPPQGQDAPVFRFLANLATSPLPLVAAVDGMAVGIGTTMLFHCDLVYASPEARLHVPFIDLGLVPEGGSSILMPRTMGHGQAARMLMLGEPLTAEEALANGVLAGIVPASDLAAHALAKARALAAKPAGAMRETKALLRPNAAEVLGVIAKEAEIFAKRLRSPEAIAAFQAFMTKGKK